MFRFRNLTSSSTTTFHNWIEIETKIKEYNSHEMDTFLITRKVLLAQQNSQQVL